ncbi:MAG: hypothetical protein OXF89_16950 [Rhodospirillaceae bacterium]|nr:hypothetical protein [Rhodospirillaceae bacterium]
MHRIVLAVAAALAMTVAGCATSPAEKSSAGGAADRAAAKAESPSGVKGKELTWWERLRRYRQEPKEKPWVYGDVRPGKGMLSDDEHGFTLLRKGEGESSDPSKPTKARR